jgi:hypothetical protein
MLLAFGVAGVCVAYLSADLSPLNNVFTYGQAKISLDEPSWDPKKGQAIMGGRVISKDPMITNTGEVNLYGMMQVKIPRKVVSVWNQTGESLLEAASRDLFIFQPEEDWILLKEETEDAWHTFVYGYTQVVEPGDTTKPLFSSVTYLQVPNGLLEKGESFSIPIDAIAIQSDLLGEGKEGDSVKEQLERAYETYDAQINRNREEGY